MLTVKDALAQQSGNVFIVYLMHICPYNTEHVCVLMDGVVTNVYQRYMLAMCHALHAQKIVKEVLMSALNVSKVILYLQQTTGIVFLVLRTVKNALEWLLPSALCASMASTHRTEKV